MAARMHDARVGLDMLYTLYVHVDICKIRKKKTEIEAKDLVSSLLYPGRHRLLSCHQFGQIFTHLLSW